ncbi:hypothetical protein DPMN_174351 [Dreissena polymorpha]|uniref:Uncharacterized protein n=1 Tax=Dreissena polymorpha TaxID=45954 RepID=A0A9D4E4K4_DREPO|nr:hypothetical protein DPMN_174351 [Dreissena polymorpha]
MTMPGCTLLGRWRWPACLHSCRDPRVRGCTLTITWSLPSPPTYSLARMNHTL